MANGRSKQIDGGGAAVDRPGPAAMRGGGHADLVRRSTEVGESLTSAIGHRRSPGRPVPAVQRRIVEQVVGADLSAAGISTI
jgi:hypothetical protein